MILCPSGIDWNTPAINWPNAIDYLLLSTGWSTSATNGSSFGRGKEHIIFDMSLIIPALAQKLTLNNYALSKHLKLEAIQEN